MFESLVAVGVVCIIGSIVGGGLKMLGSELPVLASVRRQLLLAAVGVALIIFAFVVFKPGSSSPDQRVAAEITRAVETSNAVWAAAINNLDAGALEQVYTGPLLVQNRSDIERYRREGQRRTVTQLGFRATDLRMVGQDRATLVAEEDWTDRIIDRNGNLIRSKDPWKIRVSYRLVQLSGRWMVEQASITER